MKSPKYVKMDNVVYQFMPGGLPLSMREKIPEVAIIENDEYIDKLIALNKHRKLIYSTHENVNYMNDAIDASTLLSPCAWELKNLIDDSITAGSAIESLLLKVPETETIVSSLCCGSVCMHVSNNMRMILDATLNKLPADSVFKNIKDAIWYTTDRSVEIVETMLELSDESLIQASLQHAMAANTYGLLLTIVNELSIYHEWHPAKSDATNILTSVFSQPESEIMSAQMENDSLNNFTNALLSIFPVTDKIKESEEFLREFSKLIKFSIELRNQVTKRSSPIWYISKFNYNIIVHICSAVLIMLKIDTNYIDKLIHLLTVSKTEIVTNSSDSDISIAIFDMYGQLIPLKDAIIEVYEKEE